MSQDLTPATFLPFVGTAFRAGDLPHVLTLTAIERPDAETWREKGFGREPFTLVFQGRPDAVLSEGFCALKTEQGDRFELYVVPVQTPSGDRQDYQAVFN
jgi:hypothetical protein